MNTPLSYSVTRWKDGGWQHIDDAVSPEEPVYVSWSGSSCRLWAWPDDLEPLAIGHVLLDRRHLGPEAGPASTRNTPLPWNSSAWRKKGTMKRPPSS